MNFEQLSEKEHRDAIFKKIRKKKIKKFFEFQVENIYFYDLIIFQNITVKIINVPFQEKTITLEDLTPENSFDYRDFIIIFSILILSYFFILEFFTIWYKENILETGLNFSENEFLVNTIISMISHNISVSKQLSILNFLFNSTLIDFLNFYGHLR